jgi:hypothetical protein
MRVAAGEVEVLLEVGRFEMDRVVELNMIHAYVDVQRTLEEEVCQVNWMG